MEDVESIMTRLLNGLNCEIENIVELQHYVELGKRKMRKGVIGWPIF